ncbi:hypothetical protein BDY21DRAFT_330731 [Lineolata rhizophorae]|uniref:Uncharacterized protein n=1 Tax=Lineolata rhizophorae TaxID=578093 RepID=A0A6A6PEP8_9PEZI|nr:hypothetical protein BDY21DRAFT_330731 [Lineolata rhizophorae]
MRRAEGICQAVPSRPAGSPSDPASGDVTGHGAGSHGVGRHGAKWDGIGASASAVPCGCDGQAGAGADCE